MQQIEAKHQRRENRDKRPAWLRRVIETAAELFEPIEDVGRVGFVSRPTEEGWIVDLYLGSEEQFGGAEDGWHRPMNFRFDLAKLEAMFDDVATFRFNASTPGGAWRTGDAAAGDGTSVTIRGNIENHPLTIHIHAAPPAEAEAGFRRHTDGHREMRD